MKWMCFITIFMKPEDIRAEFKQRQISIHWTSALSLSAQVESNEANWSEVKYAPPKTELKSKCSHTTLRQEATHFVFSFIHGCFESGVSYDTRRQRGRRRWSSFMVLRYSNSLLAQFVSLCRLMTITLLSHETRQIIFNLSQRPSLWLHPGATLKHLQPALVTNGPR